MLIEGSKIWLPSYAEVFGADEELLHTYNDAADINESDASLDVLFGGVAV